MISVALAVPHAPWAPGRAESFDRLMTELETWRANAPGPVRAFTDRVPNHVWSQALWTWGAESGAEWLLQLQDDVRVCPRFEAVVQTMLEAVPEDCDVIGLEVAHQAAPALHAEGSRWFTTTDMLIGVGYVIRTKALREFLAWRASNLKPGAIEHVTEDTLLAVWCMVTGRRIWHPLPTIIDHDTTLASTYGNDKHENRRPLVRWDTGNWNLLGSMFWRPRAAANPEVPHVGRFYAVTPYIAATWVQDVTPADLAEYRSDDGAAVLRGLHIRALAKQWRPPHYRVMLCTPHRGDGVSPEYANAVWQTARLVGVDLANEVELVHVRQEHDDVVRVRSRHVNIVYALGDTYLLFADSDNAWDPRVVAAMLRTGKDFVQAPYLRRDGKGYTIRATEKDRKSGRTAQEDVHPDGTIEIEHTGFGLTLLSPACLKRMVCEYQGKGLDYVDLIDGVPTNVVGLFMLMIRDNCLLSEDASFCTRWRDIGGKVWLYIGEGSPIAHYGRYCYQGDIEDLGFSRKAAE